MATCTDLPSKIAPSQGWCTGSTPVRAAKATRFRISGNRKSVQIRFYYGRISTKAPESAQNATCVNLDQQGINKTKGGKDEKTSLNCIGGNWVTFCARTAFRRSDYSWRWGSRNGIWLSRLPIRLLSIRLRVLPIWILPTVSVLQLLLWAVILLVQRTPLLSPPPSSSLLSVLS